MLEPCGNIDDETSRRIFSGVLEKMRDRLFNQHRISQYTRQIARHVDPQVVALELSALARDRPVDEFDDIDGIMLRPDVPGRNFGGIKQFLDIVVESLGLLKNGFDQRLDLPVLSYGRHAIE